MTFPRFIPLGVLILVTSYTLATEPVSYQSGQFEREQQLREQQQIEKLQARPDVFIPESSATEIVPEEPIEVGLCFTIKKIELEGAPAQWKEWLEKAIPFSLPMCLNSHHIHFIYQTLERQILYRGYLTSHIALPAQNLQRGILTLQVQPGYMGRIRTKEGATDWALLSAFPMKTGDILNLRDIEQGLEQLMRPRTQQARMEITSSGFPGNSDIVVIRENQFPLTYGLSIDNGGEEATAKWLTSGYIVWDRPLKLNDSLIFFYNQDSGRLSKPGRQGKSLYYTLPWGNWIWGLNLSQNQYRQFWYGNESFPNAGTISSWGMTVERMLHRTQKSKTSLNLHASKKTSEESLEGIDFLFKKGVCINVFGLDGMHRHYLGRSIIDLQVGIKSIGWCGDLPSGQTLDRLVVYNGKVKARVPLGQTRGQWHGELHWQYSPESDLYPSEEFSIGHHYTVRGFRREAKGTKGLYLRNELAWSIVPSNEEKRRLEMYLGLDGGRVIQSSTVTNLVGGVIGCRGALTKHISAELSVELPIHAPSNWPKERYTYFKISVNG